MPIDLSNPITVNVTSIAEKPNGGAQVYVEVPEISNYPFPIHLNVDQAEHLKGTGEYKALLVQGKLKNGKDGSWQSDYWYNVAMFEGISDPRNMPKKEFPPVQPEPQYVEEVKPPTEVEVGSDLPNSDDFSWKVRQLSYLADMSPKDKLIVRQVLAKEASLHAVGDTVEEILISFDLLLKGMTDVFYGTYQSSPLVEQASKEGAKIVDIRPKEQLFEPEESSLDEIVWYYKKPEKDIKSYAEFVLYVKNCGWILEDVVKWLGMEVEAYVSQTGKGYMSAAKLCKDKAIDQGLEPPFDFRQEKK